MSESASDDTGAYVGQELGLFEAAHNWKSYFAERVKPFVVGDVLEVGAGFGVNVPYLWTDRVKRWESLEPDAALCVEYRQRKADGGFPGDASITAGTLADLPPDDRFDTILYIDVLEHIEDDAREFQDAFARLNPGGHLAILCPAHNYLFSPFDKAIGHFRRYNKRMYRSLSASRPVVLEYLDSVGMAASIANRMLLRQSYPTKRQVQAWDGTLVPMSRLLDPITLRVCGKSILGVWNKPA